MVRDGRPVNSTIASREAEFRGVNTPEHLWSSGESIRREIVEGHLSRGVRMMDPSSVWIGPAVTIEPDVSIDPFVQIWGKTAIARGSHVGAFSILRNMTLSEGADVVSHAVLSDSRLERGSSGRALHRPAGRSGSRRGCSSPESSRQKESSEREARPPTSPTSETLP
ncbi:hypothetical protein MASR2M17_02070 [Aminivibrio sp.]